MPLPYKDIAMITVELKDEEVSAALNRVAEHLTDMSLLMNEIGEQLEYETEQRFDQGVAPDGSAWAAKSQPQSTPIRHGGKEWIFGRYMDRTLTAPLCARASFATMAQTLSKLAPIRSKQPSCSSAQQRAHLERLRMGHPCPGAISPRVPFLGSQTRTGQIS